MDFISIIFGLMPFEIPSCCVDNDGERCMDSWRAMAKVNKGTNCKSRSEDSKMLNCSNDTHEEKERIGKKRKI